MGTGENNILHFSLLSPQPYNFLVSNRLPHVESKHCYFISQKNDLCLFRLVKTSIFNGGYPVRFIG